jgi:methylenetetrahydrofolate reductase (NADPH)
MLISLEAVPRNQDALLNTAAIARAFPSIDIINVPDLLRFPVRSWDACASLAEELPGRVYIPHIRAIDFDMNEPFPLTGFFRAHNIGRVLVIAGDPPAATGPLSNGPTSEPRTAATGGHTRNAPQTVHKTYPTETAPFIRKLKAEIPELTVYAAFDPYRSNIRYELDYLQEKEDAGAEGFMSQPFFDLRLLEIYAEYLEGKQVFWGISPVLSESSRAYWESRNRAIFPKSFCPEMDWNVNFGKKVIRFCEANKFNLYLMPIKVDVKAYLAGLFG